MARPPSAKSIIRNLKKENLKFEPKNPIATEMFLPNHSGIHIDLKADTLEVGDTSLIPEDLKRVITIGGEDATMIFSDGTSRIEHGIYSGYGGFFWLDNQDGDIGCLIRGYSNQPGEPGIQAYFLEGNIGIGTAVPDKLLQVVGDCKIGEQDTNYTEFEDIGFMEAHGTARAYRDINMAGYLLTRPSSSAPDVVSFLDETGTDTTIETYGFAVGEKVHGGFELQHDYAEGTDLTFHVHWQGITAPTGTDNVQWRINYIVMRGGETLDAAVTVDSPDTTFDTQYESVRTDFAAITGTNFKIGDQFMFTLTRVAATGDAYAGDALIGTAGIHYQVNTIGSRNITTK